MKGATFKIKDRTTVGKLLDLSDNLEEISKEFESVEDKYYLNWIETCLGALQYQIYDFLEKISQSYREDKPEGVSSMDLDELMLCLEDNGFEFDSIDFGKYGVRVLKEIEDKVIPLIWVDDYEKLEEICKILRG